MIRPGDEWGTPTDAAPDLTVRGDDAALAAVVATTEGPPVLVDFEADGSDLARAVGLSERRAVAAGRQGIELPIDAIETSAGVAVNAVVLGVAPSRLRAHHRRHAVTVTVDGRVHFAGEATTVVVASGQFVGGADLVPRGHPGDGRLEIQVYALDPRERGPMRRRLPAGAHLPHPRILCTTGQSVDIATEGPAWPLELDRHPGGSATRLTATVVHPGLRLLI